MKHVSYSQYVAVVKDAGNVGEGGNPVGNNLMAFYLKEKMTPPQVAFACNPERRYTGAKCPRPVISPPSPGNGTSSSWKTTWNPRG
jgi:hypothetical protein